MDSFHLYPTEKFLSGKTRPFAEPLNGIKNRKRLHWSLIVSSDDVLNLYFWSYRAQLKYERF